MVGKYALVLSLVLIANVSVGSDAIEGVWITADGDGLIEFQVQDEQLSGVIIGSARDPNTGKNLSMYDYIVGYQHAKTTRLYRILVTG